jgi:hypothetical protein
MFDLATLSPPADSGKVHMPVNFTPIRIELPHGYEATDLNLESAIFIYNLGCASALSARVNPSNAEILRSNAIRFFDLSSDLVNKTLEDSQCDDFEEEALLHLNLYSAQGSYAALIEAGMEDGAGKAWESLLALRQAIIRKREDREWYESSWSDRSTAPSA